MIIVNFRKEEKEKDISGLWQYDYGQILRIQGLDLPAAVEIHFSLQSKGGEAVTRVGTTRDEVTDVVIPDSMLENNYLSTDYSIYVFIYLTDETSGETAYKICMRVRSRPKPEAFDTPEDAELFRDAIAMVNEAANRAAVSEESAKDYETKAGRHYEETRTLAEQVSQEKETVMSTAQEVAKRAETVSLQTERTAKDAQEVATSAEQVRSLMEQNIQTAKQITEDRAEVKKLAEQVSDNADKASTSASEASTSAKNASASGKNVKTDAQEVAQKAQKVSSDMNKVTELAQKAKEYAEAAKNGVQGDWTQNDPTQPDYIKGRTHYATTTGEEEITEPLKLEFDGDMADKTSVYLGDDIYFVKISDITPTNEELQAGNGTVATSAQDMSANIADMTDSLYEEEFAILIYSGMPVTLVSRQANFTLSGSDADLFIEEPGCYVICMPESGVYVKRVYFPSVTYLKKTEDIVTLPEKFLPEKLRNVVWTAKKTIERTEIIPETTAVTANNAIDLTGDLTVSVGDVFYITLDGVEYTTSPAEQEMFINDPVMAAIAEVDGSGVFLLTFIGTGNTVMGFISNGSVDYTNGISHTFKISAYKDVYSKIPEEHLPSELVTPTYFTELTEDSIKEMYKLWFKGYPVRYNGKEIVYMQYDAVDSFHWIFAVDLHGFYYFDGFERDMGTEESNRRLHLFLSRDSVELRARDGNSGTEEYYEIKMDVNGVLSVYDSSGNKVEQPVEAKKIILQSSTEGSTKKFKVTVDDTGTIKATEITE